MNSNHLIAKIFEEIADALEFLGDNPFKVRAYRTASYILESLEEDISVYIQKGEKIFGIGEDLKEKILEFIKTGKIKKHEELLSKIPRGIFDIMKIPYIGPKTAKTLYEELGVDNIEKLKKIVESGDLLRIKGFGIKKLENIKKGIELYQKLSERYPIGEIYQDVINLKNYISSISGVQKVELVGSFRRFKETIGDIDILICSEKNISEDILKHPKIKDIFSKGDTKISFSYELSNTRLIQVDIRVVEERSWGAALMYFTGSKEHNILLREFAAEKGYKLNEYGIFRDNIYIGGRSEEEVYKILEIQYIPPEIREGRNEIELAKKYLIPKLVEITDIKGDLQVHSRYSDGIMDFWEIEAEALKLNYEYIAITDHSKSLKVAGGMEVEDLIRRNKEIKKFNENSKVKLLLGAEVEILSDGSLDYPDEILEQLDIVLASIHNVRKDEDITERYLKAMENPFVDIIAHPTGRLVSYREPYKLDLDAIFKKASERKIILEINAHYNRLDLNDINILKAKRYNVKFSIGTDAHNRNGFGMMGFGIKMAKKAILTKEDIINTLSYEELISFIKECRRHRISEK
ncbi:MAG: DNA polymerase/3'-5' exonuclease PolX [candidate division WOR-3 bacterium]|nr:DNA polymerase/3'-5' exonuclease PolX [candidate division WOR-3 bacterium]MCX7947766.1 DNA polymerase/3'-5' exonuclease PolX [candidate division WOR-3 bacterium]MDW8150310.1 DNA polymerase/3'-5' exonuclease PolX [candidate division WOR-3 bacterium]